MRLLDGINDTEDELYTFDSIMETEVKYNGLDALEDIKGNCDLFDEGYQWDNEFSKQFDSDIDTIERELKAVKTIKNKQVNVKNLIEYCYNIALSYEEYVDDFNYSDNYFDLGKDLLTENEYDLLNEVLL